VTQLQILTAYYGQQCKGVQKQGFGPDKITFGQIGPETLRMIEQDPRNFIAYPILKPIELAYSEPIVKTTQLAYEYSLHSRTSFTQAASEMINVLRLRGYDCDGLIEAGLAIVHQDYDIKKLL
jgi:hypothetical protein